MFNIFNNFLINFNLYIIGFGLKLTKKILRRNKLVGIIYYFLEW